MKLIEQEKLVKRTLRIPRELYDEITKAAEAHDLSVNAEIVERLEAASVVDQFNKLSLEMAEIKRLVKELLERS